MSKCKFSRSVDNSSEDDLHTFIAVLVFQCEIFSKLLYLNCTFLFGNVRTLPAGWTTRDLNSGANKKLPHSNTGPETDSHSSTIIPGLFTRDLAAGA